MIVTIDVGNTTIAVGLFNNRRQCSFFAIPRDAYRRGAIIRKLRREKVKQVHMCVLCSVVPRLNAQIKKEIREFFACPIYIIGKDILLTIKHRYKKIRTLGNDRLVNVYGALRLYKTPFVVIDFGTAITFDYVNKQGVYEG